MLRERVSVGSAVDTRQIVTLSSKVLVGVIAANVNSWASVVFVDEALIVTG